jgi:AraC family transcriptional regulator
MTDELRTLGFGVTFDMVAAHTACGQHLTLTSHRPGDEIPPHRHANDYICIVLNGGFGEIQSRDCVERKSGSVFAYRAGETHHDRFGPRGAMCVNLHFEAGDRRIQHVDGLCSLPLRLAADRLAFELAARSTEELSLASLAAEVLGEIGILGSPAAESAEWVRRIVEAICDEPRRRWTLCELAQIADRHPVRVAQAFRAQSGMSLGSFQRLRRLVCLSLALRSDCEPLATLACDFGYFDQSHMNLEFRAAFGVSPGMYRLAFH